MTGPAQSAESVRIQWEGGLRVDDPQFWGCAGCKAIFETDSRLKWHVQRESDMAEENRRLRHALKLILDGPEAVQ